MARPKAKKSRDKKRKDVRREEEPIREENSPFQIQDSDIYGRYLAASRDLNQGEVILQEEPIVVAPSQECQPVCIACYVPLDCELSSRCSRCGFPLCSATCNGIGERTGHNPEECQLLSKTNVKNIPVRILQQSLDAIGPLRCLALRTKSPKDWAILSAMETHTEKRQKVLSLWSTNQRKVVDVIRLQWGLLDFEEEIIHQMCGVLEVNAFEVTGHLRAVYPTAYLFAHNCVPNTRHSDANNFNITFRTTLPVRKKSPLFVTYTYILQGTERRRAHLMKTKFFDCGCERCKDPSELGTNVSALKCQQCSVGLVSSVTSMQPGATWLCNTPNCGYAVPSSSVSALTEKIFEELDLIDGNDIPAYEAFIDKNSKILYSGHYLCLSALHCLFQLYGKIDGYLINSMSDEQLERKVEICQTLLEAFQVLEPGLSKQRGLIQYELHAPLMIQLQKCYQERKVGKIEMKQKLKNVIRCLDDARKCLGVEPEGSESAQIALEATQALDNLTSWKTLISQI